MALPCKRNRELFIVGSGDCGQLGHGEDELEFEKPKKFKFFSDKSIVQIACGGLHTVAVGEAGQVWTWGCNDDQALGRAGAEDQPCLVDLPNSRVVSASAGDSHSECSPRGTESLNPALLALCDPSPCAETALAADAAWYARCPPQRRR